MTIAVLAQVTASFAPRRRLDACCGGAMTESGGAVRGNGGNRLRDALTGGDSGASQPATQDLLNAILQLGHLPTQSTAEEKQLAVRLIRARKAGTLSSQQEAQLFTLQPSTRVHPEDSGASAGASRQAQASASAVRVDAGGGASQPAAAVSGAAQPAEGTGAAALAKQKAQKQTDLRRMRKTEKLMQQVRDLGRYPKESSGCSPAEKQLARQLRDARKAKELSPEQEAELQTLQVLQKSEERMQQVRDLGRIPKENAGRSLAERQLAEKVRRARKAKQFSPEQEAELQTLEQADAQTKDKVEELMQQVRVLGRLPKGKCRA